MLPKITIMVLLVTTTLVSCDPGIGVAITNPTTTEKNIRVIYPAGTRLPFNVMHPAKDSIYTYQLGIRDNYKYPHPGSYGAGKPFL